MISACAAVKKRSEFMISSPGYALGIDRTDAFLY
jgi:hypothetical protein